MKLLSEYLDCQIHNSFNEFNRELNTDENKEYRRGFRAGVLFSQLLLKSNIGNMNDAITEQATD